MIDFEQWEGFEGRIWKEEVNVRDFIQKNYTPYDGDESFLAGPTEATDKLWGALQKLQKAERAKGGVLDMETEVVSGLTAYGPGYIDESLKEFEQIVGLQTDKPLKRAFMPYGGIKMAEQACTTYGYQPSEELHKIFTDYTRTHNQAVFDAYTPEMKTARHTHIITGLPDTYGRGRIVGDYRRVALYGIDALAVDAVFDEVMAVAPRIIPHLTDVSSELEQAWNEGKSVLFKAFADVNAYDINLALTDPDKIIEVVKALEPTFGGINLEDIKAPECFYIEEVLKKEMNIPVFHDDQHGTAIISGAGLINALEITGKKAEDFIVVVSGAGAAAIACAKFYTELGIDPANIRMFDSKGILHKGRTDLNKYKAQFALSEDMTMTEALKGADLFLGLSKKDLLTPDMIKGMADHPVIFACANPDPEIAYPLAMETRPDCIMGTGRTDFPNQINNLSGFPYIFRGALDVYATEINEAMKLAAARALAALAKEPVPAEVSAAYQGQTFSFGQGYVIPKPFDPRLIEWLPPAVAQAAMDTGVARKPIEDMDAYKASLRVRIQKAQGRANALIESYK